MYKFFITTTFLLLSACCPLLPFDCYSTIEKNIDIQGPQEQFLWYKLNGAYEDDLNGERNVWYRRFVLYIKKKNPYDIRLPVKAEVYLMTDSCSRRLDATDVVLDESTYSAVIIEIRIPPVLKSKIRIVIIRENQPDVTFDFSIEMTPNREWHSILLDIFRNL